MDNKPLTGVRKRQQIDSANKQMMMWVGIAAAVVTICSMLSINLYQHIMYQSKVISKKSETDKVLKDGIDSVSKLMSNVNALQTDANLLALRVDSSDTAFNVVLDALPTADDRTALGSSMQDKILAGTGVKLESFDPNYANSAANTTATTGTTSSISSVKPGAQAIKFTFTISGTYESINTALLAVEKTIRPIVIDSIIIQGSDDDLRASISATTYYVPRANYVLGEEKVLPDGYNDTGTGGTE